MAEWASQFEGEHGATELVGLAVDSHGDVALAGHVFEEGGSIMDGRKDAIVMKLASGDGSTLWARNIGVKGSHDWSSAVAADRAGNIFVGGQTDGSLFAEAEGVGQDLWVAKLDGLGGELIWGYQVGSSGQDVASALTVDGTTNDGDVVVCGSTTGALFEEPGFLYEGSGGEKAEETGTGAFCAKFAGSDGHVIWGRRVKGGLNDGLLAAAMDPLTGDIFATGYTEAAGGSDYLVVRLSGWDGSERWRSTGGGGWTSAGFADSHVRDSACALAVDETGNIVIAGNTEGALFGDTAAGQETDAFVAKLDGLNGTRLWGWQGGSAGNDYANAVALDSVGDVYACGAAPRGMFSDLESDAPKGYEGDAAGHAGVDRRWDNDDMSETPYGQQAGGEEIVADMFVAKLDGQTGDLVWGEQFGSGADDEAVALVLGPDAPAGTVGANEAIGSLDEEVTDVGNSLYLTGWTRGALFSNVPARWQDGWAVKLPNPPPKMLGVSSSKVDDPLPYTPGTRTSGSTGVQQAAAERGAITAGLVGTVTGMLVVVSLGLYFVLRKASHAGGSLTASRYDSAKDSDPTNGLFRRRGRPVLHETVGKGAGGSGGSGGSKGQDSVELTLLSDGGDGGRTSPSNAKRDTIPLPVGVQQPTFYL
ncbi:unnamed protein product [Scytosiphon promiscuus]